MGVQRPSTTIVVVPRENFSLARQCLETMLSNTAPGTPLVYVDAGSPPRVARYLKAVANERGFTLLRTEHHLAPNQARNYGLAHVDTEFVAFVDNDVYVEPGWLTALEDCARDTGATLVGPVYLCGYRSAAHIHQAGGLNRVVVENGRRIHRETHAHAGKSLAAVARELHRGETEQVEFHCMLARRRVLEDMGQLDEGFLSMDEHLDLCLSVRQHGGTVWFEPKAVVSYVIPKRPAVSDITFWVLRWSDAWNDASIRHFWEKWDLTPDEHAMHVQRQYGATKRNIAYRPYRSPTSRVTRRVLGRAPRPLPDRLAQALIYRREERRRRRGASPTVVVAPARPS
jgi:GT2 family glycosyltransferase